MSPSVPDSVLNFWEMWKERPAPTIGASIVGDGEPRLYFEINEDFNLNLKIEDLRSDKQQRIWERLSCIDWKRLNSKGRPRRYRQQVLVLYEIDFGFLKNSSNMPQVVHRLGKTVETVVKALA